MVGLALVEEIHGPVGAVEALQMSVQEVLVAQVALEGLEVMERQILLQVLQFSTQAAEALV
jgi:hypothetical protein